MKKLLFICLVTISCGEYITSPTNNNPDFEHIYSVTEEENNEQVIKVFWKKKRSLNLYICIYHVQTDTRWTIANLNNGQLGSSAEWRSSQYFISKGALFEFWTYEMPDETKPWMITNIHKYRVE